jgi:SMC interacting uncharacterized protein involved in chromosome segregation
MGASALLLAGFLVPTPAAKAGETHDSEQVSKLLSEAKTLAFQVKEDAIAMEGFTRMNVSMESHAAAINQIRDDVNALGKQVAKLKAAEDGAAPWQKAAIERINPFLDELGGYTSAVIEQINGDRKRNAADYKDYLEANRDYATDLAAMIADFVNYGNSKDRIDRLGAKLEVK